LRIGADPAIGAVDDQTVEFDVFGVFGGQQIAVAAIDDAGGRNRANDPGSLLSLSDALCNGVRRPTFL
jgi:hypothetical protein